MGKNLMLGLLRNVVTCGSANVRLERWTGTRRAGSETTFVMKWIVEPGQSSRSGYSRAVYKDVLVDDSKMMDLELYVMALSKRLEGLGLKNFPLGGNTWEFYRQHQLGSVPFYPNDLVLAALGNLEFNRQLRVGVGVGNFGPLRGSCGDLFSPLLSLLGFVMDFGGQVFYNEPLLSLRPGECIKSIDFLPGLEQAFLDVGFATTRCNQIVPLLEVKANGY